MLTIRTTSDAAARSFSCKEGAVLADSTLSNSGCGLYCYAVVLGSMFAFWSSPAGLERELQGHPEFAIKVPMLRPWEK